MQVNDSTADSKKAAWSAPKLRELDVSRNTKAAVPMMKLEGLFYSPS